MNQRRVDDSIFTARRYVSAVYTVVLCLSVRPSVCLSVTILHCRYQNGKM